MVSLSQGTLQILGLVGLALGVYFLNKNRPKAALYRPLLLYAWVPTVLSGALIIYVLAAKLHLPSLLFSTPIPVIEYNEAHRLACFDARNKGYWNEAAKIMSERHKSEARFSLGFADNIEPYLNGIIFFMGVSFAAIPVWLRLFYCVIKSFFSKQYAESSALRAEWGILLPIINNSTVLTLFTSPYYFFYLQPRRAYDCMYTSGHWYTFGCTLLAFFFIITHILSYINGSEYKLGASVGGKDDDNKAVVKQVKNQLRSLLRAYVACFSVYF